MKKYRTRFDLNARKEVEALEKVAQKMIDYLSKRWPDFDWKDPEIEWHKVSKEITLITSPKGLLKLRVSLQRTDTETGYNWWCVYPEVFILGTVSMPKILKTTALKSEGRLCLPVTDSFMPWHLAIDQAMDEVEDRVIRASEISLSLFEKFVKVIEL